MTEPARKDNVVSMTASEAAPPRPARKRSRRQAVAPMPTMPVLDTLEVERDRWAVKLANLNDYIAGMDAAEDRRHSQFRTIEGERLDQLNSEVARLDTAFKAEADQAATERASERQAYQGKGVEVERLR